MSPGTSARLPSAPAVQLLLPCSAGYRGIPPTAAWLAGFQPSTPFVACRFALRLKDKLVDLAVRQAAQGSGSL